MSSTASVPNLGDVLAGVEGWPAGLRAFSAQLAT
jgi:hypothetical protein